MLCHEDGIARSPSLGDGTLTSDFSDFKSCQQITQPQDIVIATQTDQVFRQFFPCPQPHPQVGRVWSCPLASTQLNKTEKTPSNKRISLNWDQLTKASLHRATGKMPWYFKKPILAATHSAPPGKMTSAFDKSTLSSIPKLSTHSICRWLLR